MKWMPSSFATKRGFERICYRRILPFPTPPTNAFRCLLVVMRERRSQSGLSVVAGIYAGGAPIRAFVPVSESPAVVRAMKRTHLRFHAS